MKQASFDLNLEKKFQILTKAAIQSLVEDHEMISRDTFSESSLESTSYDVRVGKKAVLGGSGIVIDLTQQSLVLDPGTYAGIISFEKFKLSNHVCAQIGSKRKMSYEGIILLTGSVVDAGYEGHLLFGLYNASTKKVVLPSRTKICTITFINLDIDVTPIGSDPSLIKGDFPNDFINSMANTDVLPWSKITEEVRKIQEITAQILDLKKQYSDVLEPIKQLTINISKVNGDVAALGEQIRAMASQVSRLDTLTERNASQIAEVIAGIKLCTSNISQVAARTDQQETDLRSIDKTLTATSVWVKVLWAIILVFAGGLASAFLVPLLKSLLTKNP